MMTGLGFYRKRDLKPNKRKMAEMPEIYSWRESQNKNRTCLIVRTGNRKNECTFQGNQEWFSLLEFIFMLLIKDASYSYRFDIREWNDFGRIHSFLK